MPAAAGWDHRPWRTCTGPAISQRKECAYAQVLRDISPSSQGGDHRVHPGCPCVRCVHSAGEGELFHDRLPAPRRRFGGGARRYEGRVRQLASKRPRLRGGHRPCHGRWAFAGLGRNRRRERGYVVGYRSGHPYPFGPARRGNRCQLENRRRLPVPGGRRIGQGQGSGAPYPPGVRGNRCLPGLA